MPRRRGTGRGTQYPRGNTSGVTLSTIPSGVTIDQYAVNILGQYGVVGVTAGLMFKHGVADSANHFSGISNVLQIATGLTSLITLIPNPYADAGAGGVSIVQWAARGTAGGATIYCYSHEGVPASAQSGVSIHWFAFGT
jgi:hypothetical protein